MIIIYCQMLSVMGELRENGESLQSSRGRRIGAHNKHQISEGSISSRNILWSCDIQFLWTAYIMSNDITRRCQFSADRSMDPFSKSRASILK